MTAHYAHYHSPAGCTEHADIVARDAALDIAASGWEPTAENYLERVPKSRVLEAVLEVKGQQYVDMIAHMRKSEMAKEAERMLQGSGWLSIGTEL